MRSDIYNQTFGVEIELTRITRNHAAKVISDHFGGTRVSHLSDYYDSWTALDTTGRVWRCMSDASINCVPESGSRSSAYTSCEVVTPVLRYEDLDDLQEIVRKLRNEGAVANESCGIHVHVGGDRHDAYSVTRLLNMMEKRQNLIYEALAIPSRRVNAYCKKMNKRLVRAFREANKTKESLKPVWYGALNEGGSSYTAYNDNHSHYDCTRYHGINLHAWYTKGTVEFRLFNGTTHAGKIKAYVQFCLAMSAYALGDESNHTCVNARFESTDNMTAEEKAKAMVSFLENRLGMKGKEFATARTHLTAGFQS